ncbi:MAG: methyltransferase domain-containing protein [Chloroflexi bacterium]|nr:methyltransferase domain-containing protein [Chloroflexota bacterium]
MSSTELGAFTDVDQAADAGQLVRHLDAVSSVLTDAPYRRRKWELLQASGGMRLLDVGCGSGSDLPALVQLVQPGGIVSGVDKSESMLTEARRSVEAAGLTVELKHGDVYTLPWPDATFRRLSL